MVHCIYERVIKLKRNFKKLYIVFCRYCCCLHIRICCSKPLEGVLAFAVITSTFATVTGFLWLPDQSGDGLLQEPIAKFSFLISYTSKTLTDGAEIPFVREKVF